MQSRILIIVVAAASAIAAGQPKSNSPTVADLAGHSVLVVGRVDLQKLDVEALARLARDGLVAQDSEAGFGKRLGVALPAFKALAANWRKQMLDAGGREVFVLLDLAGIPDSPVVLAVPTLSGHRSQETEQQHAARIKTLANLLRFGRAKVPDGGVPPAPWPDVRTRGPWLLLGRGDLLDRLGRAKAVPRPQLLAAMESGKGAAVSVAFAPSRLTRRAVREIARPVRHPVRMDPAEVMADLRWTGLRVVLQPAPSVEMQIQAVDADGARRLSRLLQEAVQRILAEDEIQRLGQAGVDLQAVRRALDFQVRGSSVWLGLDRGQIVELLNAVVTPGVAAARQEARLAASASRMRGAAQAVLVYAAAYRGTWPESLEALVQAERVDRRMLHLAHRPGVRIVYRKPPTPQDKIETPSETVLLYEPIGQDWPGRAVVAFADGHVEIVRDVRRYRKLTDGE